MPQPPWSVEFLNEDVLADLSALSVEIRARFERIVRLIEGYGLKTCASPTLNILRVRCGRCA
jgi:hypothetical protein